MRYLTMVRAIVRKDLRIEARTGHRLAVMGAFAVLAGVLFNYAIDRALVRPADLIAGLVWLTLVFGGLLGLGQSFQLEEENRALEGVLRTPVPRDALFLGKLVANLVLLLVLEALILVVFGIFFGVSFTARLPALAALLFAGTVGFAALGTLFAAVTARTSLRSSLLPVLVFPLLVPVVVFGTSATSRVLAGLPFSESSGALRLLAAFAVMAVGLGASLFRFVVEEG